MALNTFLDFSTTAASNVDVAGIGIQGANAVSNFDDAFRQLMAILRRDIDNGMVLTSKSANYTAVANDNNAVIRFSAAATLSLTAAATLGADWHVWVMADGGSVIVDPNSTETINGATTITIPDGRSTLIICDGTNFRALEDYIDLQPAVDVASATTTDIGAVASKYVRVTGTTTITGLGTATSGTFRRVRFADALTLTHNGTSLILPGSANITTAAGDIFEFVSEGSGNWRCVDYQPAIPAIAYKSGSASSAATMDIVFSDLVSLGYTRFDLDITRALPSTDNSDLRMFVSVDGGSNFVSSGYITNAISFAASYSADTGTTGHIPVNISTTSIGNQTDETAVAFCRFTTSPVFNIAGDLRFQSGTPTPAAGMFFGRYGSASVNAIRLAFDAGNITGDWSLRAYKS